MKKSRWNELTLTQKAIVIALKNGQVPKFVQEILDKRAKTEKVYTNYGNK